MPKTSIRTRQVAVLVADGCNASEVAAVEQALKQAGAQIKIVANRGGNINSQEGKELVSDRTFLTAASVMFDAVYVPGGAKSVAALQQEDDALNFIKEAFQHCKAIAASSEGVELLTLAGIMGVNLAGNKLISAHGVVTSPKPEDLKQFAQALVDAMMPHRHWARMHKQQLALA